MTLTLLAAIAAVLPHAELGWDGDADGEVLESRCAVDIQVDGLLATATATHVLESTGKRPAVAVYRFALPARAAIIDLTLRGWKGKARATAVAVDAAVAIYTGIDLQVPSGATPDPGLVRLIGIDDDHDRRVYELRVYPVAPGSPVTVQLKWIAPLDYTGGRLRLRIPARGDAPNLAREAVSLSLRAPAGANAFGPITVGARSLARSARARTDRFRFDAPRTDDLVIEATPVFTPVRRPITEIATMPLGSGRGAIAISMLAPRVIGDHVPDHDVIVLVIDVSRSMERPGLVAAAAIADALLAAADPSTRVEVVLFDRRARRVLGSLVGNGPATRGRIRDAVRAARLDNGSDLGAGLELARQVVDSADTGGRALVVVVGDGMWPLDQTADTAMQRFGALSALGAQFVGIAVVPDDATLPDQRGGALSDLVRHTDGRQLALRHGEVAERAPRLYAELSQISAITEIAVESLTILDIALPDRLEPGEGRVAIGWYHGKPPARLSFTGTQQEGEIEWRARRGSAALARAAGALAVASEEPSSAGHLIAAARARAVSAGASLVALDPGDRFARDRRAMLQKWGAATFTALRPPPERDLDHRYVELTVAPREPTIHLGEARLTGELDAGIVKRLLQTHVAPRAKICYDRQLRRDRALAGTLLVRVEIARGEVQHAAIERSNLNSDALAVCILDAAYQIPVPAVTRGSAQEVTYVARYPLVFRMRHRRGEVGLGSPDDAGSRPRHNDPLEGIDRAKP